MGSNGKSIAAAVTAAVILVLSVALGHGHVTTGAWVQLAISVISAVMVWLTPRTTHYPWVKTGAYALLVVLNGAASLLVGSHTHLTTPEWVNLLVAALGTLAVAKAPATLHTTGTTTVTDGP